MYILRLGVKKGTYTSQLRRKHNLIFHIIFIKSFQAKSFKPFHKETY